TAGARAASNAGQYAVASTRAQQVVERAAPLSYAPLSADALKVHGSAESLLGHWEVAERILGEAIVAADRGGVDSVRGDALVGRAFVLDKLTRYGEAEVLLHEAEALAERMHDGQLRARAKTTAAAVLSSRGDLPGAVALARQALSQASASGVDDDTIA